MIISIIIINSTWRAAIYEKQISNASAYRLNLLSNPLSLQTIDIVDDIIKEVFARYQIMNLSHEENLYISDKRQYKIMEDVLKLVFEAISDNIIDKLSFIYKKEYIQDLIAQKVQMIVLQFVIETNGSYRDEKEPII